MSAGKNTLLELLSAGEITVLDSKITKFVKTGVIDPAFLNVLNLNLEDAQVHTPVFLQPAARGRSLVRSAAGAKVCLFRKHSRGTAGEVVDPNRDKAWREEREAWRGEGSSCNA